MVTAFRSGCWQEAITRRNAEIFSNPGVSLPESRNSIAPLVVHPNPKFASGYRRMAGKIRNVPLQGKVAEFTGQTGKDGEFNASGCQARRRAQRARQP